MKTWPLIFVTAGFLLSQKPPALAADTSSSPPSPRAAPEIVSVRKIWEGASHNAFTDLVRHHDRWWCVFREGAKHVSPDGAVRVITSTDGEDWESAAVLTNALADLRDPKLTMTPAGKFMLTAAGAWHRPNPNTHQTWVWFSGDGRTWSQPEPIGDAGYWLWRVTWHKDQCFGIGYECNHRMRNIRLYQSGDGTHFTNLVDNLYDQGGPNETSLVFLPDGTALCLLRRDPGNGLLGTSQAPYHDWTWKDLGCRIGGPRLALLPDGRLVATVRLYDRRVRTAVCEVDRQAGKLRELVTLPSGGDTSYAGLVWEAGVLWVSYYSSHEGKTSIYLAKLKWP